MRVCGAHVCICECIVHVRAVYVCVCLFVQVYCIRVVHKQMFYIRTNLRMLQHSNVECNIRMFVLCNKMMYFGDFVVLAA